MKYSKLIRLSVTAFIALLVFLPSLYAQSGIESTGTLNGAVTVGDDTTRIAGVLVSVPLIHRGVLTRSNGTFSISGIAEGTYDVEVSLIGYARKRLENIHISAGRSSHISVHLESAPFEFDEVVVTGSFQRHLLKNTPLVTEIITRHDISAAGSSDLGEIMKMQTGIEIGTSISQTQSARLQGLGKNQVLVLVDGERITGKVDDAIDLAQIPVNMIDHIEVVKGPLSSIYGSDALGGVINVITRDADHSSTLHTSVTGGSNGRQDYELSAAYSMNNLLGVGNGLRVLANIGWNKYFGIEYDAAENLMAVPENDRKNFNIKTGINFGNGISLDFKADYYKDRLDWKAGTDGYYLFMDHSGNDKLSLSGSANVTIGATTVMKFSAVASRNDHTSSEQNQFGYLLRDNTAREAIQTYRAQITTVPYQHSILTAGVENTVESARSPRIQSFEKRFINYVGYVEDEWTLFPLTITFGGRYSDNSIYGTFFAPRVNFMYTFNDNLKLRASYGRGYRAPSTLELFIDYPNLGVGYFVKGNPDLQPESSHGFNVGLDYASGGFAWFRVNAFFNRVDNLINYYLVSQQPNVYSYHNIEHAATAGIDLDVDVHPCENVIFNMGYNYTSSRDNRGNEIPFHAPHSLTSRITWMLGERDFVFVIKGKWYGRMTVVDEQVNLDVQNGGQDAQRLRTGDYFIFDTRVSKQLFAFFNAFAGINNITDKRTYPFGQIKGREFYAGISLDLN